MKRLALALCALLLGLSHAQQWTVQTVALQNYQEALDVSTQLRALDYDAYVDFGLYEGQQFVRVRVGCFDDQDSAAFFASQLLGRVTAEAVAVPLDGEPGAAACVRRLVGFAPPAKWDTLEKTGSSISFWVDVLGQRRFVMFTGTGWRVAQSEPELASLTVALSEDTGEDAAEDTAAEVFRQDAASRILGTLNGVTYAVTTGQLLWQRGAWSVVLEDGAVAAYHVDGVR